ncbi:phage holin [Bacillus sp. CGMCC 1.16607]|uniref:phage holin n=1 Tax=Bacillus sp. CGMCC 1.16607 TaxID=3351842 RepID=UPI00363E8651
MINWKVRLKNKGWVMAFASQIIIMVQIILATLNSYGVVDFQITDQIKGEILTLINSAFIILSMLGVVQDPTTKGLGDSKRALDYEEPQ